MIELLKKIAEAAAEEAVALVVEALHALHNRVSSLERAQPGIVHEPDIRTVPAFPNAGVSRLAAPASSPAASGCPDHPDVAQGPNGCTADNCTFSPSSSN